MGPLVASATNYHYFVNPQGRSVLLAGSHSWNVEQDTDMSASPAPMNFTNFVNFILSHNQNCTILWHKDLPTYFNWGPGGTWTMTPFPWQRLGPGNASDGLLRFDFTQFNQSYFDRLRARALQLQQSHIYAIVELFDGLGLINNRGAGDGYPFSSGNNVNGIADDNALSSMTMTSANAITAVQDAYVQKVIDTLNDLQNVIWEVSEEAPTASSTFWSGHMINLIHSYEAGKPLKHPVFLPTTQVPGNDSALQNTNADVIALVAKFPGTTNCGTGTPACKPNINDSDHSYFGMWLDSAQVNRQYLWENVMNGHNVVFMDPYLINWASQSRNLCVSPVNGVCSGPDTRWDNFRDNIGQAVAYGIRVGLLNMTPQPALSSTGFALANNGVEYLVYAPTGGTFTVDLSAAPTKNFNVEWFDGVRILTQPAGFQIGGSSTQSFTPPGGFTADAVLYLW